MNCPKCDHEKTKTLYTYKRIDRIERLRECVECRHKFRTVEYDEDLINNITEIVLKLSERQANNER